MNKQEISDFCNPMARIKWQESLVHEVSENLVQPLTDMARDVFGHQSVYVCEYKKSARFKGKPQLILIDDYQDYVVKDIISAREMRFDSRIEVLIYLRQIVQQLHNITDELKEGSL